MSDLSAALTGLAQGITGYVQTNQKVKADQNQAAYQSQLDTQKEIAVNAAKAGEKGETDPILTADMAEKVLPGAGGKLVTDYNTQNPTKPLKLSQGVAYLKQAQDALAGPDTEKEDKHQDVLEGQAINRISSVRGDAAVARAELQRDAAGQAYDTISKAEHESRDLTSLEQTDLLAQLFQARTGKAPTDTDMKLINDKTAKQGLNQAVTYLTGDPGLVGASTKDTLANLKQFIVSTGSKADSNHEGYMAPHLIKPTGLSDDRWQHILASHRGISFKDQMTTSDKTYSKNDSIEAKKAALKAKLGL